jgi:hypothetical protein
MHRAGPVVASYSPVRTRVPSAVTLLTATGCSFVVSTSGLSGGSASVQRDPDAASFTDAPATRTGTDDGGPDAADGRPFCATSSHAACLDFDEEVEAGTNGWAPWEGTGPLVRVVDRFKSAPASLELSLPALPSGSSSTYATIVKTFAGPWRRVVVEFDIYLDPPAWAPGDSAAGFLCIGYKSSSGNPGIRSSFNQGETVAEVPSGYTPPGKPLPTGDWVHVKADLDPAGSFTESIGNDITLTRSFAPVTAGANPSLVVDVGFNDYNTPLPAFTAWIDNVTVDFP